MWICDPIIKVTGDVTVDIQLETELGRRVVTSFDSGNGKG